MTRLPSAFWPLVCAIALTACSSVPAEKSAPTSGYLSKDVYAKLEKLETDNNVDAMRWLDPRLNFTNYQKILIDNVVLYPEPVPGPQVSAETLEKIQAYLTQELVAKVSTVVEVTNEPGPGVLRMDTAVTGVELKTEGMQVYEVVPVAAVFGGVKALTGTRDRDVQVFLEVKFSDSQSGEVIGAAIRKIEGRQLKGMKDELELEDMQESLDTATDDAQREISRVMAKK
jgi:hypothetical protein